MAFIYLILARITTRKAIVCDAPSIVCTVFKSLCLLYNRGGKSVKFNVLQAEFTVTHMFIENYAFYLIKIRYLTPRPEHLKNICFERFLAGFS